jgi:hypothetical protein
MTSVHAEELAQSLEVEGRNTIAFFKSLTEDQWELPIYGKGPAWRAHNLLAHFTEVEGSISHLIRQVVDGHPGVPKDFDIDRWNAKHTGEISLRDRVWLLAEFESRRRATVEMVRGLNEGDLEKTGRHPALGITEVKRMIRTMYLHIQGHQRDIKRAMKAT